MVQYAFGAKLPLEVDVVMMITRDAPASQPTRQRNKTSNEGDQRFHKFHHLFMEQGIWSQVCTAKEGCATENQEVNKQLLQWLLCAVDQEQEAENWTCGEK